MRKKKELCICPRSFSLALLCLFCLSSSSPAATNPLLKKYIIEYNLTAIEKSLEDDSYRGEEGILRIRPEIANKLGIKAFINEDYRDSIRLFKEADNALEKAKRFMLSRQKEKYPGYFTKNIADNFLLYKTNAQEAKKSC